MPAVRAVVSGVCVRTSAEIAAAVSPHGRLLGGGDARRRWNVAGLPCSCRRSAKALSLAPPPRPRAPPPSARCSRTARAASASSPAAAATRAERHTL